MGMRFPETLESESFSQAWDYVAGRYRMSQTCCVVKSMVEPVGHSLFFVIVSIFTCGMLYTHLDFPGLQAFFEKAPWFVRMWEGVYSRFFSGSLAGDLAVCAAAAWGIPFVLCAVLTGLAFLCHRPRIAAAPEGDDPREKARTLLNTARAARRSTRRIDARISSSTAILYLLLMAVLLTLFYLQLIQTGKASMSSLPENTPAILSVVICFILVGYTLVSQPLALLLKLLYWCPIPSAHMEAMERFLTSLDGQLSEESTGSFPATDPDSLPKGFWNRDIWFTRLSGFPCPITGETFPNAWRWASRKLQWAARRRLIFRPVQLVSQPIFAAVLLVLTYGALYQQKIPLVNAYLSQQPKIMSLWWRIRFALYPAGATRMEQGIIWAALLYLLPLALSCVIALAAALVYHPKPRKQDMTDTPMEQSRQLCLLLREAKEKAKKPDTNIIGTCNVIFGAVWMFAAFGFILFCANAPESKAFVEEKAHLANLGLFLAFLVTALSYQIIALPLTLGLRLLTFTWVPKKALELSENWFARCEEAVPEEKPADQAGDCHASLRADSQ